MPYQVHYIVDGDIEDEVKKETEPEAIALAAEWAREGRADFDGVRNPDVTVDVIVQQVTLIAQFPVVNKAGD